MAKLKISLAAAAAGLMVTAVPASAAPSFNAPLPATFETQWAQFEVGSEEAWEHRRDRYRDNRRGRYNDPRRGYRGQRVYYDEPVRANTRVWRGRDGRVHCQKKDGTTGLIIGGAVGALLGREIDGGRDRTLGTVLGAAGGAFLGNEIAKGGSRCR